MKLSKLKATILLITMFIFIAACSLPGSSAESTETIATDVPTKEAASTESAVHPITEEAPEIQHTNIPTGLPEKQSGQAVDFDASKVLETQKIIGGDRFTFEKFERPFNSTTMDVYFSEIDIVNTMVFQDDVWIYGVMTLNQLEGDNAQNVKYAIELDVDLDGKGDWLIIATKPTSGNWGVEGVQVFKDNNKDVGGEQPMLTDNIPATGDGFETLIFDQGQGNDPDTAWVRISPNDPNTVEFAVNLNALENPKKYLINMWAGTNLIDPAIFDLSDKFTHDQAGAADSGLNIYYPIKDVAEIDNSCRMAVGFQPTGMEPGLCVVLIPVVPGIEPLPSGSACVQQSCSAEYTWNPATCTCDYSGPR